MSVKTTTEPAEQHAAHVLIVDDLRDDEQKRAAAALGGGYGATGGAAGGDDRDQSKCVQCDTAGATAPAGAASASTLLLHDRKDLVEMGDASWIWTQNRPVWLNLLAALALVGCGMVEGVAMNRSGLIDPLAITSQFTFRSWIVLPVFISAVGASCFFQALLDLALPSLFRKTRVTRVSRAGYARAVAGGLGVGAGLALAGSGPTILPAQLGANAGHAWVTLLGMMAGAVSYAVFDHFFGERIAAAPVKDDDIVALDERLGVSYWKLGLPVGAVFFGVACALNFTVMAKDKQVSELTVGALPWPAVALGAFIGLFQLAYRVLANRAQGGATSYMLIVSTLTCGKLSPKTWPGTLQVKGSPLWQFLFVWVGSSLGSLAVARTTDDMREPVGLPVWRSFVGGFVVLFSARISNSCTCGSISQMGENGFEGTLLGAVIFIGAIATAWILVAAGAQPGC